MIRKMLLYTFQPQNHVDNIRKKCTNIYIYIYLLPIYHDKYFIVIFFFIVIFHAYEYNIILYLIYEIF